MRYQDTPHNLGFRVIEELAKRHFIRISRNEGIALTGNGKIRDNDVLLVKPQTFMNNSGAGIHGVLKSRRMTNKDLIVVYDELDLPWTALRIKNGTGSPVNPMAIF